jgi:hypothetical protein
VVLRSIVAAQHDLVVRGGCNYIFVRNVYIYQFIQNFVAAFGSGAICGLLEQRLPLQGAGNFLLNGKKSPKNVSFSRIGPCP